ncbi:glutamyl-tRNA synthetase [mine drainage metagenome]|uniref:Glutamyl-tRNA synthetase n=1 Tax=mine drainage metagenome TaxID=410659 RepID=T0YTZ3_9ZZZZ
MVPVKKKSPVLIIKTDLKHPNPSVRDWIAFRIIQGKHPRIGEKYRFYPMMNFSVAIDDHELGLTHVIRGTDHISNTERQKYIFKYFEWVIPEYFHYGFISIPDSILKTSIIKKGINDGNYSGWDDTRLQTLCSMKKRGYTPETFRRYWIESGLRDVNAEFSWEIFNSINRQIVDANADRYFFVNLPKLIKVNGSPEVHSKIPRYQGKFERGYREYDICPNPEIFISNDDFNNLKDGETLRLKDLFNVKFNFGKFEYQGTEPTGDRLRIIHWCPPDSNDFKVERNNGGVDIGLIEPEATGKKGIFQLERYGFINKISDSSGIYLHN